MFGALAEPTVTWYRLVMLKGMAEVDIVKIHVRVCPLDGCQGRLAHLDADPLTLAHALPLDLARLYDVDWEAVGLLAQNRTIHVIAVHHRTLHVAEGRVVVPAAIPHATELYVLGMVHPAVQAVRSIHTVTEQACWPVHVRCCCVQRKLMLQGPVASEQSQQSGPERAIDVLITDGFAVRTHDIHRTRVGTPGFH